MTGPDVRLSDGRPHGVFEWAVPPALVVALSDLLDGRAVSELAS
jgi:exodeoxyribonuclease V beta subunit